MQFPSIGAELLYKPIPTAHPPQLSKMSKINVNDDQIALMNFVFSCISSVASLSAVTLIFISFRRQTIPLRGNLVLLLVFSNWLNATNNALSSYWVNVAGNPGLTGAACVVNGVLGQVTVQIGDLTTLAIAILVYTVLNSKQPSRLQNRYNALFPYAIVSIIFIGFSTATIGGFINGFEWLGSWCWFRHGVDSDSHTATIVRYTLTHGPRIIIFSVLIALYLRLFLQLRVYATTKFLTEETVMRPPSYTTQDDVEGQKALASHHQQLKLNKTINRMLLFPVIYIILWSGGIANRVAEASGAHSSITEFLQTFTQLIGFFDSIVYVFGTYQALLHAA
jgi:hypothetical protein